MIRLYLLTALIGVFSALRAAETPIFINFEEFSYRIYSFGLSVGVATVTFQSGQTLEITLAAESRGLADLLVPFRISCHSVYDPRTLRTIEYSQKVRFKKISEYFVIRQVNNFFSLYFLVEPESEMYKKYACFEDRGYCVEGYKSLRLTNFYKTGEVDDPLSLLYRMRCFSKESILQITLPVIIGNQFREIKVIRSKNGHGVELKPDLNIPGVFPPDAKGSILFSSAEPPVPERVDLDVPGLGRFRITRY
ncbi:MAG: DUF3108 domain-containing protein [Candidatus Wallbacteria bacterium]|nr:DUF3108 domain-containing protein [Candidatus Wallbacteria bacterium]